jgi:hypothetical protein
LKKTKFKEYWEPEAGILRSIRNSNLVRLIDFSIFFILQTKGKVEKGFNFVHMEGDKATKGLKSLLMAIVEITTAQLLV